MTSAGASQPGSGQATIRSRRWDGCLDMTYSAVPVEGSDPASVAGYGPPAHRNYALSAAGSPVPELVAPATEVGDLGSVAGQLDRPIVRGAGLLRAAEPA